MSGTDVAGNTNIGGLVGYGLDSHIYYVYVHNGSVAGTREAAISGLVGDGGSATIRYSYAAGGRVSTVDTSLGGPGGLVGVADDATTVNASYWDTNTTGQSMSALNLGEGKTTLELQSPTTFTGIYADWDGIWCDPDTGEVMEGDTQPAGFLSVWDLGDADQYPVLSCLPGGLSAQGR